MQKSAKYAILSSIAFVVVALGVGAMLLNLPSKGEQPYHRLDYHSPQYQKEAVIINSYDPQYWCPQCQYNNWYKPKKCNERMKLVGKLNIISCEEENPGPSP